MSTITVSASGVGSSLQQILEADDIVPGSSPSYELCKLIYTYHTLGAKIVEFGDWLMPLQYSGILDEHRAVRSAVGLFDVSHMGEILFTGPTAAQAVQRSAFPQAYAQHEPASRSLASSLRGYSPAAFTCQLNEAGRGSATAVLDDVNAAFGSLGGVVEGDDVVTRFTGPPDDTRIRG